MSELFDFAVLTIFAREFLEGSIIVGEYRTIVLRADALEPGVEKDRALREITLSALLATVVALIVIAAIAIPLAVLSHNFDETTSKIIEGVSKIVAGICLLQLSLKIPKFLGIYGSCKKRKRTDEQLEDTARDASTSSSLEGRDYLTIRSIRFNVAWNVWREVAECGVFLIPFFLSGENLQAIPISALIGSVVGLALGVGIYFANKTLEKKIYLAVFAALLLVFLSAGLLVGGCHNIEKEVGMTQVVWQLEADIWSVDRLPMTILKPFGWSDTRTVLQITIYWGWLLLSALLHYRKYKISPRPSPASGEQARVESFDEETPAASEPGTDTLGDSSLEEGVVPGKGVVG